MIELKHEGGQKWNVTGQTPSIAIRPCGRRRMQMHSICSLAEQKEGPPFISPLPSPLLPSYFYTLHIFATTKQD